jgi:hypothetical protein
LKREAPLSLGDDVLHMMMIDAHLTKRKTSRDDELDEANELSHKMLPKTLFAPPGVGSLGMTILETCSPCYRCTPMIGMK